jgi:hypothetical protein
MAGKKSAPKPAPRATKARKPGGRASKAAPPAKKVVARALKIVDAPPAARGALIRSEGIPTAPRLDVAAIAKSATAHLQSTQPLPSVRNGAEKQSRTDARGKYVYCIIQTTEPLRFGPIGIGSEPADVHTVNYENVAAVVSDTPIEVHDPTRENVLAHERVNETVMRNHTVIPMSFGTVFKTREDIIELLRSAYDAFHDVLVKMQNKLEFGLKVLWDRDVMIREIEVEDEDISRLRNELSNQKGSTYFARMQYGRLVDAALQLRSERFVADIFEQLRGVSVASRANKPIGDKMIMNAAFLVTRELEAEFDAKVKQIGAQYDKLTFKYTGPWPPYNFVNIRLKLERAKEAK